MVTKNKKRCYGRRLDWLGTRKQFRHSSRPRAGRSPDIRIECSPDAWPFMAFSGISNQASAEHSGIIRWPPGPGPWAVMQLIIVTLSKIPAVPCRAVHWLVVAHYQLLHLPSVRPTGFKIRLGWSKSFCATCLSMVCWQRRYVRSLMSACFCCLNACTDWSCHVFVRRVVMIRELQHSLQRDVFIRFSSKK